MRLAPVLLSAAATALFAVWGLPTAEPTWANLAAAAGPGERLVTYAGVTVRVPAAWPVYDLAAAPRTCVRYDVNAVYLGHPGADQDCPAHAMGRADTLSIEPRAVPRDRPLDDGDPAAEMTLSRHVGAVQLTASYADDAGEAETILGSARPAGGARHGAVARSAEQAASDAAYQAETALADAPQNADPQGLGPGTAEPAALDRPTPRSRPETSTTAQPESPTPSPTSPMPSQPTSQPTSQTTAQPTTQPTSQTAPQPTSQTTSQTTTQTAPQPTTQTTSQTTSQTAVQPTTQTAAQTTARPTTQTTPHLNAVATFSGNGFDTCAAPSLATMSTWKTASPFRAAGVYIGGADRACPDGNLTPSWVHQVGAMGWRMFPIYVGRQAACWQDPSGSKNKAPRIQHDRRWTQGVQAADDAAGRATFFGLAPGSTVYFDMEYYPRAVTPCAQDVQAFLNAWTDELHKRGFLSGIYSSARGAVADMALIYDTQAAYRADAVWFAHWDAKANTSGDSALSDKLWPGHKRIKQFAGGHDATYGGKKLNIDSDVLDAPVAALVSPKPPAGGPSRSRSGLTRPVPKNQKSTTSR